MLQLIGDRDLLGTLFKALPHSMQEDALSFAEQTVVPGPGGRIIQHMVIVAQSKVTGNIDSMGTGKTVPTVCAIYALQFKDDLLNLPDGFTFQGGP